MFVSGAATDDIYSVNPDGGRLVNVTRSPLSRESTPVVSPDGSRVAYTRHTDGDVHVYVMNSDGSGKRRVSTDNGRAPKWSPDGRRIAWATLSDDGVYVANADGTDARGLADDAEGSGFAWSPSRREIAYPRPEGIAVDRVDGGGRRVLGTRAQDVQDPAWSPDGTTIAFLAAGGLHVIRADGSGERLLAQADWVPSAAWSPDSRLILFGRGGSIGVIRADGRSEKLLTRREWGEVSSGPAWSPDGGRIVFARGRYPGCCGSTDLWVMNADGSRKRPLTTAWATAGASAMEPSWGRGPSAKGPLRRASRTIAPRPARFVRPGAGVSALALDGSQVAYESGCRIRLHDLRVRPGPGWPVRSPCDALNDLPALETLVVGGSRAAWLLTTFIGYRIVATRGASAPKTVLEIDNDEEIDNNHGLTTVGRLDADGPLIVFNTWRSVRVRGDWQKREAKLWRIVGDRPRVIRTGADAATPLAVDAGRILVLRDDGDLVLLDGAGRRLRRYDFPRGVLRAARLHGSRLAVQARVGLAVYDIPTGRRIRTWGIDGGVAGSARLEDVHGGFAAYVAGIAIHVIRLSDGRDRVLAVPRQGEPTYVQLERSGLVYSYRVTWTRRPARIAVVPWSELRARFRS